MAGSGEAYFLQSLFDPDRIMNTTPPLLDLLGVSWQVKAPALALAWDPRGRTLGCALRDGIVVLADSAWEGGPTLVPRPGGGSEVVAAKQAAPEPLRVRAHPGACLDLRADRLGGFLTGGADGRLVHISTSGACSQLATRPGQPVDAVASGSAGVRAWACGKNVYRLRLQREDSIELTNTATALAFDPAGCCLAIAHAGGVTLWALAESDSQAAPRHLAWPGDHLALTWSRDGRYLVSGLAEDALHGWSVAEGSDIELHPYPGQPRSLAFSSDGRYLVAAGASRPTLWGFDPPGSGEAPDTCGSPGKTPATQVACHPNQTLIAAGYQHGAVALCQPGSADVLVVKGSGEGAVTALAWSPDGERLGFGTADGSFGWVNLPAALFRVRGAA